MIIFVLGKVLNIYKYNDTLEVIVSIMPDDSGYLDLADKFENIWIDYKLNNADQYILLLRDRAGFTDSRVIGTWLRGARMFKNKSYHTLKISDEDWDVEDIESIKLTIQKAIDNTEFAFYTSEPNIGVK
jgi:hypothetical protein